MIMIYYLRLECPARGD